jgi:hypothetical protein
MVLGWRRNPGERSRRETDTCRGWSGGNRAGLVWKFFVSAPSFQQHDLASNGLVRDTHLTKGTVDYFTNMTFRRAVCPAARRSKK